MMDGSSQHVSVVPRVRCDVGRRDAFPLRRFTLCRGTTRCVTVAPRPRCALPGTGRHKWRPYVSSRRVPIATRASIATRRFAPSNVGAPPRTPGTPPQPRHDGRFIAARSLRCMFIAAWDDAARFRCGGSRCALPGTGRHEWRPYGSPRRAPLWRGGQTRRAAPVRERPAVWWQGAACPRRPAQQSGSGVMSL